MLTGPGGVGKTRLAVHVARALASDFPDGAYLVPLSGLRDERLLANTVTAALGLPERVAPAGMAALLPRLRGKRMLLILDNCEHLLDACATFADQLLRGADGPRLIATSRQALDIPGEVIYPIPPMAVPDDGGDALALFTDRVRSAAPGFTVTDANRAQVVMLCRGLDGIPLALELAAVRIRSVGLTEMITRLGDRMRLLGGSGQQGADRHQTLQAAIGWSYDLCSATEKLLWARLSVFPGEFGLDAAEQVCAGDGLGPESLVNALIGLVDKSIVTRVDASIGARYRLLDTIREFGARLLADAGTYLHRHRDHYLALARDFDAAFLGPGQADWIRRLGADHANLRLALEYFLGNGDPAWDGLVMAAALWGFWASTGKLGEGRYWLDRLLDQVLSGTGEPVPGAWLTGLFLDGHGDQDNMLRVLARVRSVALARGDEAGLAWTDGCIALAGALRGDPAGSAATFAGLADRFRRLGDMRGLAINSNRTAAAHLLAGDFPAAIAECDQALRRLPQGECWLRGWTLWVRGLASWLAGDAGTAAQCYRAGLRLRQQLDSGDMLGVAPLLDAMAWLAADEGDFARAARLQGAADRMWRSVVSVPRLAMSLLNRQHELARDRAQTALGQLGYERQYAAGAMLDLPAVLRSALAHPGSAVPLAVLPCGAAAAALVSGASAPGTTPYDSDEGEGPPAVAASPWDVLTAREREVAALVAQGLTNRDIATRLVVSKRTVDAHVEHILAKLGFTSRVQVATLAALPAQGQRVAAADQARPGARGQGPPAVKARPADEASPAELAPMLMRPGRAAGDRSRATPGRAGGSPGRRSGPAADDR
jgi:predicted ATPase/DNA-binding CsgD family transcriptional regulator